MGGEPDELKKIYEGGRADGGFDYMSMYRLGRQGAYGSYFAEHAIYAAYMYPRPNPAADGSVVMPVAKVILGQSKDLGKEMNGNLVREPPIEGGAAGELRLRSGNGRELRSPRGSRTPPPATGCEAIRRQPAGRGVVWQAVHRV